MLSNIHPNALGAATGRWPSAFLPFCSSCDLEVDVLLVDMASTKPRMKQDMEKLILPLLHSPAVGLYPLGFFPCIHGVFIFSFVWP